MCFGLTTRAPIGRPTGAAARCGPDARFAAQPVQAGGNAGLSSLQALPRTERLSGERTGTRRNNAIIADGITFHKSRCVIR